MEDYLMDVRQRNEQYTWIPAFKAIADWIVDYEDKQEDLVDILIDLGVDKGLQDQVIQGEDSKVKVMEPFTFFSLLMKFQKPENRIDYVNRLIDKIGIDIKHIKDIDGVPTANPRGVWLFAYSFERKPNVIKQLWDLFKQAKENNISSKTFDAALEIKYTGFTKLTQNLFYINPSHYLPLDGQTQPWISTQNIDTPNEDFASYQAFLEEVRIKTNGKPFWEISHEAWLANQNDQVKKNKVESSQVEYRMSSTFESKNYKTTNDVILNRILYGPPGTGKTYYTTELAVHCLAPDWYYELNNEYLDEPERRKFIKAKYDELTAKGRIAFTTFHQSFAYEDFVEGIRAKTDKETKQIYYEVESGVFKQIAKKAGNTIKSEKFEGLSNSPKIWKLSIGEVKEREFRKNCFDNSEARIGWHKTGDLNVDYDNRTLVEKSYWDSLKKAQSSLNCFANDILIGDVILCLKSESSIQAIGIVTSDYKYDENAKGLNQYYPHVRSVKWIARGMNLNILPLNNNYKMVPQACYELFRFNWDDLLNEVKKQNQYQFLKLVTQKAVDKENYVLIIDEINRGNISRIFGELITLLEPDKRKGGTDAREVILPYSKEKFSVPSNLYVLGTMNTADKSLAQLDLALRRRFDFVELLPQPKLLGGIKVHGIAVSKILTVMNQRIEVLLDREHVIGHSYFWSLKDLDSDDEREIELGNIFKRRIIPLLQEYFFSDWERIGWVLNDPSKHNSERFIQTGNISPVISELFDSSIKGLNDRRYHINETAFNNPESYKKILIQTEYKSSDSEA